MIPKGLFAFALVLASQQVSYGEVVEITRAGPTCDPSRCSLMVEIRGEITETTVTQLTRIIDRIRRKAEADKLWFSFLGVELNSPGGSVKAAMAIGRIIR